MSNEMIMQLQTNNYRESLLNDQLSFCTKLYHFRKSSLEIGFTLFNC